MFDWKLTTLLFVVVIFASSMISLFIYTEEKKIHNIKIEKNQIIELINFYEARLTKVNKAHKDFINKLQESCLLGPGDLYSQSLTGNLAIKVEELGWYNVTWIKKGYKSPDGKFLTTCTTSE